jgi:hypothetical protein
MAGNRSGSESFGVAMKLYRRAGAKARAVCSLLEAIGEFVFDLRYSCWKELNSRNALAQSISTQCTNLVFLGILWCRLTGSLIAALVHGLRSSGFCTTLAVLDLSGNALTDADIVPLVEFSSDSKQTPAIQEFVLCDNKITAIGINTLGDALQVNKTLQLLSVCRKRNTTLYSLMLGLHIFKIHGLNFARSHVTFCPVPPLYHVRLESRCLLATAVGSRTREVYVKSFR